MREGVRSTARQEEAARPSRMQHDRCTTAAGAAGVRSARLGATSSRGALRASRAQRKAQAVPRWGVLLGLHAVMPPGRRGRGACACSGALLLRQCAVAAQPCLEHAASARMLCCRLL